MNTRTNTSCQTNVPQFRHKLNSWLAPNNKNITVTSKEAKSIGAKIARDSFKDIKITLP